ncbi:MAG: biotin-dependent carboxyltransferase family protein [Oscillospiraceae bacterium]|nr:biotin-dependent carboxyltransferase family protein [Candidatus Equicaccousia limihippi]
MGIKILNGGALTTVQDSGRRGYQRFGLGVSGAVDVHSYIYANILVGNSLNDAVLEATLIGPEIEFTTSAVIAVTGADMSPTVNRNSIENYRAIKVNKGDILSFGELKYGCRTYIAFAGGLDLPLVMGSRSTYIRANLGGLEGRKLQNGDIIEFDRKDEMPKNLEKRKMAPVRFDTNCTVRVLMGPQEERFTAEGIETFLSKEYRFTNDFDRMGCRLDGPIIEHVTDGNIITDGITFGAIQVPDGKPIIMLSDRQTTGGYAKIASVINEDMSLVAQCKAGDGIRFEKTDIETAQDLFIARKEEYKKLSADFDCDDTPAVPVNAAQPMSSPTVGNAAQTRYNLTVNGVSYDVSVTEIK